MRVLIANDKFKGSLPATEVAQAIQIGLPSNCEVDLCPIADGGEGFTSTMLTALGGQWVECDTVDALHRPLRTRYAITNTGLAVMEMASASGFELISEKDRDILQSSTYGTGLMIRHAADQKNVERILIGIGGSATNDGGVGMADALGVLSSRLRGRLPPSRCLAAGLAKSRHLSIAINSAKLTSDRCGL